MTEGFLAELTQHPEHSSSSIAPIFTMRIMWKLLHLALVWRAILPTTMADDLVHAYNSQHLPDQQRDEPEARRWTIPAGTPIAALESCDDLPSDGFGLSGIYLVMSSVIECPEMKVRQLTWRADTLNSAFGRSLLVSVHSAHSKNPPGSPAKSEAIMKPNVTQAATPHTHLQGLEGPCSFLDHVGRLMSSSWTKLKL